MAPARQYPTPTKIGAVLFEANESGIPLPCNGNLERHIGLTWYGNMEINEMIDLQAAVLLELRGHRSKKLLHATVLQKGHLTFVA
jgi:hypothetical protein